MGVIYHFLQGISRYSILMLLLTILNHSLKVLFLWFWDPGVQIIYAITQECREPSSEQFPPLCCCAPSTAAGHWVLCCDPHSPCLQALSSGPLPAFAVLLQFIEVCSKYANNAKAERLRIRSFSVCFCSFEGICFIFRFHHAYRASNAIRSVFL